LNNDLQQQWHQWHPRFEQRNYDDVRLHSWLLHAVYQLVDLSHILQYVWLWHWQLLLGIVLLVGSLSARLDLWGHFEDLFGGQSVLQQAVCRVQHSMSRPMWSGSGVNQG
jgi:hypothetical protein